MNSGLLFPPNLSFSEDNIVISSPGSSVFDLPSTSYEPPPPPSPTRKALWSKENAVLVENGDASTSDIDTFEPIRSSLLVISGGTGANSLCAAFGSEACYVLPVSDDGGSSSEIIRVIGGPSVGDIRSRLIRLIPTTPPNSPLHAIRALLSYRLPSDVSDHKAREEWRDIVEGSHLLWRGIPSDRKEAIRGFLVHFESEVLKRAHKGFSFRNGSIGNYFLAGTRDFLRSLPAAIFLFSAITQSQANILPVLATNHTVTIAAELENHSTVIGQCNISHPITPSQQGAQLTVESDSLDSDRLLPSRNVSFSKSPTSSSDLPYELLPSPISRVYYINSYGHEIQPWPNAELLFQLSQRDILIYSCGSLWTSIMPCLALQGLGHAIAGSKTLKAKVLLLNSENDRETHGYTAADYISAIANTLGRAYHLRCNESVNTHFRDNYPVSAFITHITYIKGCKVQLNVQKIQELGIKCVEVVGEDRNNQFTATMVHGVLRDIQNEIDKEN